MVNNFIMGGKLGDFLHAMFAVKQISEKNGIKANIYMYDIGWEFGIENTHSELKPIMMTQDYVNSFEILYDCEIDPIQTPEKNSSVRVKDKKLSSEGFIDLGGYLRSPWLYKACWSDIYSKTFGFEISGEYSWIKWNKTNPDLVYKVLIHRRNNPVRMNPEFPYEKIVDYYSAEAVFVSSSEKDYEAFPYKQVPFLKLQTLDDWFTAVNSCQMVVCNLTGPAVISHAMDKTRIIELPNIIDSVHSIGEEKYSKNMHWFIFDNFHNL